MTIKTFALVAALMIPSIASADDKKMTDKTEKTAAKLSDADTAAIAHVHHVNLMETDMGKLAQKSGSAGVKKYGEMLVRDHTTSDKEVTAFAKQHGLAKIPDVKPATEAEKAEMKEQMDAMAALKKLKGADFDKQFLQMMADGHDKELAKSDPLIAGVADAELKTMLENRKTTLKRHSDSAKELQKGNAQASAGDKVAPTK